jgi:uncharacterized protein
MLYFDTSFLTPLLLEEATSKKIEAIFATLATEQLAVSHWTQVEFSSLVAREVRMGGLVEADALVLLSQFSDLVNDSFHVLIPTAADYELAQRYIQNFATKLRAGDALHLAIASNCKARTFFTLDQTLLKAAKLVKVSAQGIKAP